MFQLSYCLCWICKKYSNNAVYVDEKAITEIFAPGFVHEFDRIRQFANGRQRDAGHIMSTS